MSEGATAAMHIIVKYFAIARESTGQREQRLDVPDQSTAGEVLEIIARAFPAIEPLKPILLLMVNQEFSGRGQVLQPGDELALIPPVSGGASAGLFRVQSDNIDPRSVEHVVEGPGVGGIVTFSGTVRDQARGKTVIGLDYEAYEPVAEKMLSRIGDEVCERWGVDRIAIVHRTGRLNVGEVSVVIAAAAAHRGEAFAACQHAIDRIKVIVPIWKKEYYEDGSYWVGTEADYQREAKVSDAV